jgi:hypothetical protein
MEVFAGGVTMPGSNGGAMQRRRQTLAVIGLMAVGLQLSACTRQAAEAEGGADEPAKVERVEGAEVSRLTLTAEAAERLGIRTKPVLAGKIGRATRRVVPYSAVLYDAKGGTWVYTNPEPLAYVRERVTVEDIQSGQAVLTDGPPEGTPVVAAGAAELYGTEFRSVTD